MSNEERQAALRIWLEERQISLQTLADAMGVTRAFVSVMLRRDTIPARRHKQLVALGLPEDLLPPIFTGAFGRPPSACFFGAMAPQEPSAAS